MGAFIVILLLNVLTVRRILVASRARKRLRAQGNVDSCRDPEMESRRKSIIVLLFISGNFILLWAAFVVFSIWMRIYCLWAITEFPPYSVQELGFMLQLLSCCTNTGLYAVTQTKFRQQLKDMVKRPVSFFTKCMIRWEDLSNCQTQWTAATGTLCKTQSAGANQRARKHLLQKWTDGVSGRDFFTPSSPEFDESRGKHRLPISATDAVWSPRSSNTFYFGELAILTRENSTPPPHTNNFSNGVFHLGLMFAGLFCQSLLPAAIRTFASVYFPCHVFCISLLVPVAVYIIVLPQNWGFLESKECSLSAVLPLIRSLIIFLASPVQLVIYFAFSRTPHTLLPLFPTFSYLLPCLSLPTSLYISSTLSSSLIPSFFSPSHSLYSSLTLFPRSLSHSAHRFLAFAFALSLFVFIPFESGSV